MGVKNAEILAADAVLVFSFSTVLPMILAIDAGSPVLVAVSGVEDSDGDSAGVTMFAAGWHLEKPS